MQTQERDLNEFVLVFNEDCLTFVKEFLQYFLRSHKIHEANDISFQK